MSRKSSNRGPRPVVFPGERYGRWEVISEAPRIKEHRRAFHCRCDCGTEATVSSHALRNGRSKSCGCQTGQRISESKVKHGHGGKGSKRTPTYNSWRSMIGRCTIPATKSYNVYGARGITVCKRWHSFDNFLADMGERPQDHTLDRVDPDGNYEPANCRWATPREQAANRRPRA